MHIFKIIVVYYYYYYSQIGRCYIYSCILKIQRAGYEFWFRELFPVLSIYGFVSNINEGHHTNSQTQKI